MTRSAEPRPADPRPALRRALDQAERIVTGVGTGQLGRPTPCAEFDVAALLGHFVGAVRRIASLGRGEPLGQLAVPTGVADDGWPAVFADATRAAVAAWEDDGLLDRKLELPWATVDGSTAVRIYLLEVVAHTWDLAVATGQAATLDDALAEQALLIAGEVLPPEPRRGEIPFHAVRPVADDAPAYDRLAAYLGRPPA